MTPADEIRDLYAYNRWANRRILNAAVTLGDEDLDRDMGSSFPSILATLAHIVAADWVWVRRWSGESPPGRPADWELSSLDRVRTKWAEVEAERDIILAALEDDDLARDVRYSDTAGTPFTSRMVDMLRHVVNHSTYHRGQVVTMLRQLGATPPATDLIAFHREKASQKE